MDMKAKHTLTNEPDLSYENIKVSILYNFSLIIGMHDFARLRTFVNRLIHKYLLTLWLWRGLRQQDYMIGIHFYVGLYNSSPMFLQLVGST